LPRLCAHRYKYVRRKLPHCGVAGGVGEGAYNPHETLPYLCVAFCVTAPDRDHVTNVIQAFLLRPASPFVRAWRPHTAARWLRRARLPAALSRARGLCLTNAGFFFALQSVPAHPLALACLSSVSPKPLPFTSSQY
jgi:hypothetical protein